jgi:hypothetical protein
LLIERVETGIRSGSLKSYICCYPPAAVLVQLYSVIPSHHSPVSDQVLTVLDVAKLRWTRSSVVS